MSGYQVPPLRPEGMSKSSKDGKSWLEEYLEGKDEILLYLTAAMGVLLPGFVYLLYHKCHAYYERYAKKKESERIAEEMAQSEAVVVVLGSEGGPAAQWGDIVYNKLCEEMIRKPFLWVSDTLQVKELMEFKGFCVFVVDTLAGGLATPSTEWFLEWLEDLAANAKMKKKANFEKIRFSLVGFGSSGDGQVGFNKVARTLLKRLKIVGAKQMTEVEIYDTVEKEELIAERFEAYVFELLEAMDRNLPGAENETDSEYDQSSAESSDDSEIYEKNKKKAK